MTDPKTTLTDGSPVTPDHREIDPATGLQKGYVVLSAEERAKGFVRPYRDSYVHVGTALRGELVMLDVHYESLGTGRTYVALDRFEVSGMKAGTYLTAEEVEQVRKTGRYGGCGAVTRMAQSIAETYARDFKFYSGTYCVGCRIHFPLDQFKWDGTDIQVGT